MAEVGIKVTTRENAAKSFGAAARSVISFNQALALAQRALRILDRGLDATIGKAVAMRGKNDEMVKTLTAAGKNMQMIGARIGDVFLPVLAAVAKAIGPVLAGINSWLKANRGVIATGIVEWTGKFAVLLVKGIGLAVVHVSRAFAGLQIIFEALKLAFASFAEVTLSGLDTMLTGMSRVLAATGADEMAAKVRNAADSVRGLGASFGETRVNAGKAIDDVLADQAKLEAGVRSTVAAVEGAVGAALAKGVVFAKNSTNLTTEAEKQALAARQAGVDKFVQGRAAMWDKYYAHLNEQAAAQAAREAELDQIRQQAASEMFSTIGGAYSTMIEGIVSGSMTGAEAMKAFAATTVDAALGAAEKVIIAHATTAGAGAASSQAAVPIIGPALAAAAMATMFALVKGLLKKLIRGADGGEVRQYAAGGDVVGGMAGRDSVRGLLMPGERVLTVPENHALKTLARSVSRGRMLGGGFSAALGGEAVSMRQGATSSALTIRAEVQNPEEMTDTQIKRWLLRINRHAEELHADGLFLAGAR